MSSKNNDSSLPDCCKNIHINLTFSAENNFENRQWYSEKNKVAFMAIEIIIAIATVLGNSLVILVFFQDRRLRHKIYYYIVSLAFADFFVGIIGIPLAIFLV